MRSGKRNDAGITPITVWGAPSTVTVEPMMSDRAPNHRRQVPSASFVFVLSDFIEPTPLETWEWALDRGWDVVPVIVQDPVWEQRFPDVDRIVVPLVGANGRMRLVRLSAGESERLRERHEQRLAELVGGLRSLGVEPVVIGREDGEHVFEAFLSWSSERQAAWGHAA